MTRHYGSVVITLEERLTVDLVCPHYISVADVYYLILK